MEFPIRNSTARNRLIWGVIFLCTTFYPCLSSGAAGMPQARTDENLASQKQIFERAKMLIDKGDYSGAAQIYKQILQADPNSYQALNNLGAIDAHLGRYAEAITVYGRALNLRPQSFPVLLNLGLCYFKAGEFEKAIKPLKRALALKPDNFQARSLLAMSLYSVKEFALASVEFKKLVEVKENNTTLQYLLAESYLLSGQYQKALSYFRYILKRSPNSAAVHMLMGEADDGLDRTDEAIKELQLAASISPNLPLLHLSLGYLYWKNQQYNVAVLQFEAEIKGKGEIGTAKAYLGDIALREGKASQARPLLEDAISLNSNIRIAHYDLGILDAQEKKYERAISEFQRAIELEPDRADAYYRLAKIYRAQGNGQLAQKALSRVSEIHEKSHETLLHEISGTTPKEADR